MKVMKKGICIFLPLVLLLIGCNKIMSSTNTLASNIGDATMPNASKQVEIANTLASNIGDATIDSVIVLGRAPYEFTSIPIGRYAFVEYCISKNVHNRIRLMNKKNDIEDIVFLLTNLEVVASLKQGEFSPADFPYKLLIKGERFYLMNADPLDVKILVVLYLNSGRAIPIWISQSYVDILEQRYYSTDVLMTKLYDFLGYEY